MDTKWTDMRILNELSEFISLRMKSYLEHTHEGKWIEHKAHIDYDLWFIQSGIVNLTIDGIEHTANAGDVVFFYPGVPYMASTNNKGCQFIYIHFDFEIGKQQRILNDFQLSGIVPQELIREEALWFAQAFRQSSRAQNMPGNRLYLKACLTAVVAKVIELYGLGQYAGTFLNGRIPRKTERNLDMLQPVFSYINNHLHKSIKMNDLAVLVGISEKYFITYFKKTLGITPGQYIYQIKMNRAREHLNEKKYTIQQIAGFLGYADPFTFSKAFKKYYNVPPSKFE
ncbi:hypothetical protein GCM10010912_56380 [Paenibacillus albidus]|uniref:HTH araC/xylS-type domain-containing protein n=1 Tax=Paenibacillus albidus TaxID=2041023 RepID=A0A917D010_9BACL|nr:AraC family transcriptional regulator [Paenibacillus albidus]GGG04343.1 hypothetical protein GCM10010912_56380 [Paenibacillus albidus]